MDEDEGQMKEIPGVDAGEALEVSKTRGEYQVSNSKG